MQADEPAPRKCLSGLFMAEESLEIGRGELDEGLKKVPLFGAMACRMPKTFKHFVAFPPVGVVVEVDPIAVILGPLPMFLRKGEELGFRLTVGMAEGIAPRVRIVPRKESIGWKRPRGVTGPSQMRRLRLYHDYARWMPVTWKMWRSCSRTAVSSFPHTQPLSMANRLDSMCNPNAAQCPQMTVVSVCFRFGILNQGK